MFLYWLIRGGLNISLRPCPFPFFFAFLLQSQTAFHVKESLVRAANASFPCLNWPSAYANANAVIPKMGCVHSIYIPVLSTFAKCSCKRSWFHEMYLLRAKIDASNQHYICALPDIVFLKIKAYWTNLIYVIYNLLVLTMLAHHVCN